MDSLTLLLLSIVEIEDARTILPPPPTTRVLLRQRTRITLMFNLIGLPQ